MRSIVIYFVFHQTKLLLNNKITHTHNKRIKMSHTIIIDIFYKNIFFGQKEIKKALTHK
jgi:hypothetical protein